MKNAGLTFALASATLFMSASVLGADSQAALEVRSRANAAINTSRLSWDLVGLAKLVQSGVDNKVVLGYIQNTPPKKNPTADELVYLHELGLSSEAMVALLNAVPATAPVAPEPQPAPATSNVTVQNTPAATQAAAPAPTVTGNTVISTPAPAPTVVYTQPAPVYVQQPVVTYVEPVRPRVTFGFSFGHFFGHGHHGHWGGHHGHWGGHHRGHWGHHGRHH